LSVPRYLFRTFDAASSGRNDGDVVVSIAGSTAPQESSRFDILSKDKQEVAQMLHMHLDKNCFGEGHKGDDLMSWTSSLPNAIQYAVWRAHIGKRHLSQISICAIDTSKFPWGQFVRDISLIEAYREAADQLKGSTSRFFDFRLNTSDYYNGEHLSQGAVKYSVRSCMMSLERLIDAGLFQLYPEFEDADGRKKWTERVRELRQIWSAEQETPDREIQLALQIARDCFAQLGRVDIASILLGSKHRKYSSLIAPGECLFRSTIISLFLSKRSN
jgi:hypothetical protein